MHGKFPNKMILLFLAVAVCARAAEDPKSAQKLLANAVLPGAKMSSAKVVHDKKLGDLEELSFTPKKKNDQRILCFVLTTPRTHETKAKAVARTWGPYCDMLLFMTSESHDELNTVLFKTHNQGTRWELWEKTKLSWMYCYEHHLNEFDWFLKADDDTYIVMKNLREFLSHYKSSDTHYFGREFILGDGLHYPSGGAGYLLSRATLKKLGENQWSFPPTVLDHEKSEDLELGRALKLLDIPVENVLGPDGIDAFLPFTPDHHRSMYRDDSWYWRYNPKAGEGEACCSRWWMTAHYLDVGPLYLMHAKVLDGLEAGGKWPSELPKV